LLLPGVPWFGSLETQGEGVQVEWQVRRQTFKEGESAMSMPTFQWLMVAGLAIIAFELFSTVRAVEAVGQVLRDIALGERRDGEPGSLPDALYRAVDRLTEIAEQAERLADCYAWATHEVRRAAEVRARQARVARAARKPQDERGVPGEEGQTK